MRLVFLAILISALFACVRHIDLDDPPPDAAFSPDSVVPFPDADTFPDAAVGVPDADTFPDGDPTPDAI